MFLSLCDTESPACVLLTDSKFGAAFFEHRYLSELLGIPWSRAPTCTSEPMAASGPERWTTTSRST